MKHLMAIAVFAILWSAASVPVARRQEFAGKQAPSPIRVETDLALFNVAVTDQDGQAVSGLERKDFKIFEDDQEQSISSFSFEKIPVSWALVLDRSGSMWEMLGDVYRAAVHVLDKGSEDDEAFIVTFSDKSELVSDYVSDRQKLRDSIRGLRAGGRTALWDAVAYALDHLKQGVHRKKVMVIITDGEDNLSRLSFHDLVRQAEEEDVLIYTVGMFEMGGLSQARKQLARLAEATGAQTHFPADVQQCEVSMAAIARDVSWQYQLGYYPTNRARDGRWRKIRVVVSRPAKPDTRYSVRTRSGYYAPSS